MIDFSHEDTTCAGMAEERWQSDDDFLFHIAVMCIYVLPTRSQFNSCGLVIITKALQHSYLQTVPLVDDMWWRTLSFEGTSCPQHWHIKSSNRTKRAESAWLRTKPGVVTSLRIQTHRIHHHRSTYSQPWWGILGLNEALHCILHRKCSYYMTSV